MACHKALFIRELRIRQRVHLHYWETRGRSNSWAKTNTSSISCSFQLYSTEKWTNWRQFRLPKEKQQLKMFPTTPSFVTAKVKVRNGSIHLGNMASWKWKWKWENYACSLLHKGECIFPTKYEFVELEWEYNEDGWNDKDSMPALSAKLSDYI